MMKTLMPCGSLLFISIFSSQIYTGNTANAKLHHHETRAVDCPESPNSEPQCCIPRQDEFLSLTFGHTDEHGNTCTCDYCRPPQYAETGCVCTPSGGEMKCVSAIKGETYMPFINKCNKPLDCTSTCPGNTIIIQDCETDRDSLCGCDENNGFYQTDDTTCSPVPKCEVNFKLDRDHQKDSKYTSFTCVQCSIDEHCPGEITTETVLDIISRLFNTYGTTLPTTEKTPSSTTKLVEKIKDSGHDIPFIIVVILSAVSFVLICSVIIAIIYWRLQGYRFRRMKRNREVNAHPRELVYVDRRNSGPNPGRLETSV